MQTAYIYAGTYSSLLENRLLSANQRELLLGTKSVADVSKVLQDTCFAPYLNAGQSLNSSLDTFVTEQKNQLAKLAPDKTINILFLRYDYSNLKIISKGLAAGETEAEIVERCSQLGTINPTRLFGLVTSNRLRFTETRLANDLAAAESQNGNGSLEDYLDYAYLNHARDIAKESNDEFANVYTTTVIDLHNLLMRLRSLVHTESEAIIVSGKFVPGGSMSKAGLESLDTVLARLYRFGGQSLWQDALTKFKEAHDFSGIDRAADNFLAQTLKRATIKQHSPAPLFAYFYSLLEHTQFVRTIVAAHNVGLPEAELRALVRNSLHDYAY